MPAVHRRDLSCAKQKDDTAFPAESAGTAMTQQPVSITAGSIRTNSSSEIVWTWIALQESVSAGNVVIPLFTYDSEGFEVNNNFYDLNLAENLVINGDITLVTVSKTPYL
jgi:hypothetical protein